STGDATYFATTGGAIAGSGVLTMSDNENNHILTNSNNANLTNGSSHTIRGSGSIGSGSNATTLYNSGTIIANQNAPLIIYAGVTNTGAMEADGGELDFSYATVTNTDGTIEGANDSVVSLNGSTVTGGVLAGSVKTASGSYSTLSDVTITDDFTGANGSTTTLNGTITNSGTISIASTGDATYFATTGGAIAGSGVLTMSDNENNHILTNSNNANLTNGSSHTIRGSGSIGSGSNATTLYNSGTIIANQSTPLYFYGTVANSGILEVKDGSEMSLAGGSLSNLSGSTLTGGVYTIAGILRLPGYVTTNAATITLDGTNAHIYYGSSGTVNALVNLSANASAGSISLTNGASATTSGSISNSGAITVGDSSTLTIGSSGSGTLTNSSAGSISGGGSIVGAVANSGTTTLGASTGPLSVTGTYTLSSASNLTVELSSETEGDSYCFLTVTGAANLGGTLTVALSGSYSPAIGSAFHIVKATGGFSSTKFATLNLPTLTAKAWLIEYGSTEVILKVVPPSLAPINSLLLSD
ncbi:MAG: beta strand repeat-containing protein, partial [Syntrophobacteraceae bacterium]